MSFDGLGLMVFAAAILDSGVRIGNRCKFSPGFGPGRASILDFRLRLANRCKLFPVYALFRASILDFRPRLGNRCKLFPGFDPGAASILDFKLRLANRCTIFPPFDPGAASILEGQTCESMQHNRCGGKEWLACSGRSGYEVCVRFYSSLPHRRIARLLRSLRQRFPRPILIFVAASKNSPPAAVVAKIGFACLQHCRGMQAGTG